MTTKKGAYPNASFNKIYYVYITQEIPLASESRHHTSELTLNIHCLRTRPLASEPFYVALNHLFIPIPVGNRLSYSIRNHALFKTRTFGHGASILRASCSGKKPHHTRTPLPKAHSDQIKSRGLTDGLPIGSLPIVGGLGKALEGVSVGGLARRSLQEHGHKRPDSAWPFENKYGVNTPDAYPIPTTTSDAYPTTSIATTPIIYSTTSSTTSPIIYPTPSSSSPAVNYTTNNTTASVIYPIPSNTTAVAIVYPTTISTTSPVVYPTPSSNTASVVYPTSSTSSSSPVVYPTPASTTNPVVYAVPSSSTSASVTYPTSSTDLPEVYPVPTTTPTGYQIPTATPAAYPIPTPAVYAVPSIAYTPA